jgi:hypothetical protein
MPLLVRLLSLCLSCDDYLLFCDVDSLSVMCVNFPDSHAFTSFDCSMQVHLGMNSST